MKRSTAMGSLAIVLLLATPAWATNYDESVNGDMTFVTDRDVCARPRFSKMAAVQ